MSTGNQSKSMTWFLEIGEIGREIGGDLVIHLPLLVVELDPDENWFKV